MPTTRLARPHLGKRLALAALVAAAVVGAHAQDAHFAYPIPEIEKRLAETPFAALEMEGQARPRIEGDRSIVVVLDAPDPAQASIKAKMKPVGARATGFNNEPRYELAAYRLQTLFLDEDDYVVPPVVLRSEPLESYRALQPEAEPTFADTSSKLYLLAYWLEDVTNRDPFREDRLDSDPDYARHWGNLNILTHLIRHRDGNLGNLLISSAPDSSRVFSVDNDVAFASEPSGQGDPWHRLRVDRLPARTIERLREIDEQDLDAALGVVAEFEIAAARLVPVEPGPNLDPRRGVRTTEERVQLGLTSAEIRRLHRRLERLLRDVERGRVETF